MPIPWSEPDFGKEEKRAVNRVLSFGWLTQGKETELFEGELAKYTGAKHAIVVSNGTMALLAALLAYDIGPGDEVITPSFTFIATVNSILGVGAKPVLADCDLKTWNLSPAEAEKLITKRTKAVMPVHIAGMPVDIDGFKKLCRKYKIHLIEDGAEALGAGYKSKRVGGTGTTTIFSFHMAKLVTTVEGGCVVTDNNKLAERIKMIRNHGRKDLYQERRHGTEYSFEGFGLNMRMTDILATIGRVQLAKIDKTLRHRKKLVEIYKRELGNKYEFQEVPQYVTNHANMFFAVICAKNSRQKIQKRLLAKGVSTRVTFTPVHQQRWHKKLFPAARFKNSEEIYSRILSLPLGNKISEAQVEEVLKILKRV